MTPYEAYRQARNQGYGTPEQEAIIATDAYWYYLYARDVIKGRFPLGETSIAKSGYWKYYLNDVPMSEEDRVMLTLKYHA